MDPVDPAIVGRITTVHGIKGWVKVHSFTEPGENIVHYSPWWLKSAEGWQKIEVDQHRATAKGLMVHLKGIDDRDIARQFCQRDIAVEKANMPSLPAGEYYWHQLEGLDVVTCQGLRLGVVDSLMETGANDVLVVKGDANSLDRQERLIPYVEQFILGVDLGARQIEVDWDPDF
ncbi:MAG: ribosome maturation factor RimM [Gammaproteobacteria bacterium]|nr:MAG: ribosome maturation factor RimM [Gammaproteobacteria bacterium]